MIIEYLKEGKSNAVSIETLMRETGLESARAIRQQVTCERQQGQLIACNMCAPGGYFIPATRDELIQYIELFEKRARGTLSTLKSARQRLEEIEGQQHINWWETDQNGQRKEE